MDIMELLQDPNHYAVVQGHHTKLSVTDKGYFAVIARNKPNSPSSPYGKFIYSDNHEQKAVEAFIKSENNEL